MVETINSKGKCSVHGCPNPGIRFWIIKGTKPRIKYLVCKECRDKLRQLKKLNSEKT